ncbi:MAG: MBL fold metallo-hydrolase [Euryhalocaulis sp.]|uniref:MBL fold metallo-hydrolase n=1 Tax=Euryhalocaulis sp. TaxID=2744307 RepID=UPI0017DE9B30|nr:MBL fold metallo-hydrolase [Euryhalocaulis sp.]MBA4802931.1 MBL fold metallo-hydrolase [Euryhalocaulis sp.]
MRCINQAMRAALALLIVLSPAAAAAQSARDTLLRSFEAHGGLDEIEAAGGATFFLDGEFDLGVRLQGQTLESEMTPMRQMIAVDTAGERVAYDLRWRNYYQSEQDLREVHDAQGRILFADKRNETAQWMPYAPVEDDQARFKRILPNFFLADALSHTPESARAETVQREDGPALAVTYQSAAGDPLTLFIDPETYLLSAASAPLDMPLLGASVIQWRWSEYKEQDGLTVPGRFMSFLNGKLLSRADMITTTDVYDRSFAAPRGIETPAAPPPGGGDDFVPYGDRAPEVETIAPGVHMVRNLRPGFHPVFIEFNDFVMAVDAPAGWYEMTQIPPMNWAQGDDADALGEKFLRAIRQTAPGKPVRYLVLTHHHSDHIGGLEPFVRQGATILAGEAAAELARGAVGKTGAPVALDGEADEDDAGILVVRNQRTIQDMSMEVRLIELPGDNPKSEGHLVVYLPDEKLLYSTAFIYPVPESDFPLVESVPLSAWFVEWLDESELEVDSLYNVHGQGRVQPWQLQQLRALAGTEAARLIE